MAAERALARRRQRGFSLIELLVAFVILTAALGVVYPLVGNALRATRVVGDQLLAVQLAENHLARLGRDLELQAGEQAGEWREGYRWHLRVEPYWPWPERTAPLEPLAWWVQLEVVWPGLGGERRQTLHSLRLAEVQADG